MKLEVEINVPCESVDIADLENRVRTEAILSLLADGAIELTQAADELGLSVSTVGALIRQRRKWNHRSVRDLDVLEGARAEAALLEQTPTIEQVRAALASISDPMSEVVTAERGAY